MTLVDALRTEPLGDKVNVLGWGIDTDDSDDATEIPEIPEIPDMPDSSLLCLCVDVSISVYSKLSSYVVFNIMAMKSS